MTGRQPQEAPAGVIRVERDGERVRVFIDGAPMPWAVDPSGVTVVASPAASPGITVTIPADRVEVSDALAPRVDPDRKAAAREYLEALSPDAAARRSG